MADAGKTNPQLPLLLLALGGAAFGFWIHGAGTGAADSAAPAPVAPAPTVMPIVVSTPGPAPTPTIQVLPASSPRVTVAGGRAVRSTSAPTQTQVIALAAPPTTSGVPSAAPSSPTVIQDYSVSVVGDRVVVASDGSIVQVGDNGSLNANTGNSSAGGSIGVDVTDSTLQPGTSTAATGTRPAVHGTITTNTTNPTSGNVPGGTTTATRTTTSSGAAFDGQLHLAPTGPTSIAGYENHSINVGGDDNLVTYDDSNVFVDRNGHINSNTGDTDSSGLNAVDVTGSVVRSGNSGDGEGGDDDEAEDVETPVPGIVSPGREAAEDSDGDDDTDVSATAPTSAPLTGATAYVDDEDVTTAASGTNPFVIGGDGYDDLAVRLFGSRNVVTYDDGNVVLGGTGDVNAQVGDSDTGGAVVMGIHNSDVQAGCEGDLCPQYASAAPVGVAFPLSH